MYRHPKGNGVKTEQKTKPTEVDVGAFLAAVTPEWKRADAENLCRLLEQWSGEKPVMWGPTIVGFDSYHYRYASGHEGDACRVGFSPRAAALTLYTISGYANESIAVAEEALLARLGKFTRSKACLYVKRLSDIDLGVLEELVRLNLAALKAKYG